MLKRLPTVLAQFVCVLLIAPAGLQAAPQAKPALLQRYFIQY